MSGAFNNAMEINKEDPYVIVALQYLVKKGNCIPWIMCGHINNKNRLPCDLYLFETELEGIRKFGISQDTKQRAATASSHEKWRYKKLLSQKSIAERWKAMVIESALKDFNNRTDNITTDRQKIYGIELTSISEVEFEAFTDKCLADLNEENLFEFCQQHCRTDASNFLEMVEHLRSGLVSLWWNPRTESLVICNDIDLGKSGAKFNYRVRKSAHGLIPIDIKKEAELVVSKNVKRKVRYLH